MNNETLLLKIEQSGTREIIISMLNELERAETKHPIWPTDLIHASAIVAEESGELIRAALQHKFEGGELHPLTVEASQTATMAVRFLKNIFLSQAMIPTDLYCKCEDQVTKYFGLPDDVKPEKQINTDFGQLVNLVCSCKQYCKE